MSEKVVRLIERSKNSDEDVIQLLEGLLEAAKQGHVKGVAVAYVRPNGTGRTVWAAHDCLIPVTGCVGMLHNDLCREAAED